MTFLHAGGLEGGDVRPALLLVEVLVAQPSGRVAGAALLGAEDGEGDPGPVEHAGGGLRRLAGPLVEGGGAAHPVEVLDVVGNGVLDHRHLEVEGVEPVGALGGAEPPRVALVLDVAEHEAGLGRERGLHEHLVAAHVDDGVDVLDVDRALLHTGATGRARPQDVGVDDASGPASRPRTPAARFLAMTRSAEANRLSRRSMITSLGESGLPVFQAGHCDWQRPHSVQVAMSRSCFQEKSSTRPAPKTTSSSSPTSSMRHVGRGGQGAEGPGTPGGGHVDGGQEDVQVLRVGDEDQEAR